MTAYEPTSWIGFAGIALIAISGIITAIITAHGAKSKAKQLSRDVVEIKEQTVNNHGGDDPDRNLRVQIDRLELLVATGLARLEGRIDTIQQTVDRIHR